MSTVRLAARHIGRRLLVLAPAVWLVTAVAIAAWPLDPGTAEASWSAALWLHLPAFLLTAAAVLAALELWPLLSRDRPGADVVARAMRTRLQGSGAVGLGALVTLAAFLTASGALAAAVLSALELAPPAVRAHHHAPAAGRAVPGGPPAIVDFGGVTARSLVLRPHPTVARGTHGDLSASVEVRADGETLTDEPLTVDVTDTELRLPLAGRRIDRVSLRVLDGGLALGLPEGAVVVIGAREHSALLNTLLAALVYLVPAALVLALATLARRHLALGVQATLVLVVLILATLAGWTPTGAAVAALARGQWVPSAAIAGASLPSLSLAALAIMGAMLRERGTAR